MKYPSLYKRSVLVQQNAWLRYRMEVERDLQTPIETSGQYERQPYRLKVFAVSLAEAGLRVFQCENAPNVDTELDRVKAFAVEVFRAARQIRVERMKKVAQRTPSLLRLVVGARPTGS